METITIDLGASRNGLINESFLRMFGWGVQAILRSMFGSSTVPVVVKGRPQEVATFARTMERERRYIESFKKHGLNNPNTTLNRQKLDKAVAAFEKETNLIWPFK